MDLKFLLKAKFKYLKEEKVYSVFYIWKKSNMANIKLRMKVIIIL
jgi:hypothetical protein